MTTTIVVSVRFKDSGRTYYFDPGNLNLRRGEMVVVDTVHGPELAKVVYEQFELTDEELVGDIKMVLRRADQKDFSNPAMQQKDYDDILERCKQKIKDHNLPMRLVKAEYNFYCSRLTFYFTADQRVDFRLLVRDLARTFKTRIELRQIGPRDEAKLLGGIGGCGRSLCCSTFLPDYTRVSIKMAKDQDLPLNPSKISGVCNRLLCCLSYEHQHYVELKAELPRRGTRVETPDGRGEVVDVNVLQQMITVRLASSGMQESYPIQHIREIDRKGACGSCDAWGHSDPDMVSDDAPVAYVYGDESDSSLMMLEEDSTDRYTYESRWSTQSEEPKETKRQRRSRRASRKGQEQAPSSGEERPRPARTRQAPPSGEERPVRRESSPAGPSSQRSRRRSAASDRAKTETSSSQEKTNSSSADEQKGEKSSSRRRPRRKRSTK